MLSQHAEIQKLGSHTAVIHTAAIPAMSTILYKHYFIGAFQCSQPSNVRILLKTRLQYTLSLV